MSSPSKGRRFVLVALFSGAISGCSVASMIETNTRAIEKTTASMDKTAEILERSNRTMEEMADKLDAVGELEAPMERVAELKSPMMDVASLGAAMDRLGAGMTRLEGRMRGMETGLGRLERPMEDVAALAEPMKKVAALEGAMTRVGKLDESMEKVAALREPMEKVSEIEPSLTALAAVGKPSSMKAAGYALGALAAWGFVTFLGVYFGFRAGLGRARGGAAADPREDKGRREGSGAKSAADDERPPESGTRPNLRAHRPESDRGGGGPRGMPRS
jgi:hypothetical protein